MEVQIRRAGVSDLDLLVRWRMEVLREVFPPSHFSFPEGLEEENRAYYRRALPAGTHLACFASVDGQIVGCGGLCLSEEMPSPDNPTGRCAYLMNVYCRPPFRRAGVGEAIVRWLVERARERHIPKIYLETSGPGRKLYEKLGFRDMPDMMILPGEGASDSDEIQSAQ